MSPALEVEEKHWSTTSPEWRAVVAIDARDDPASTVRRLLCSSYGNLFTMHGEIFTTWSTEIVDLENPNNNPRSRDAGWREEPVRDQLIL